MVATKVPARWEERLVEHRLEKDEAFRDSPDTPLRAEDVPGFSGLDYWPPEPSLRFVGPVLPYAERLRFDVPTTAGGVRPVERYGYLSLIHDGEVFLLQVYRLLDNPAADLFLPFKDTTSGTETYPAGRYLDLEALGDGRWVADFNYAYNPHCAYGDPDRFACPVTPRENHLPFAVEAGERGFWRPSSDPARESDGAG